MEHTTEFDCESPLHEGDRHIAHTGKFTTGYGVMKDENGVEHKHCYACCAKLDEAEMIKTGTIGLYLTCDTKKENGVIVRNNWCISNWPGSLTFKVLRATHNKQGHWCYGGWQPREDGWFVGPDGYVWHIVVKGDMDCGTARRNNSGKWYVGHKGGKQMTFRCNFVPTEQTHGHLFGYTDGPYSRKEMVKKGLIQ